jgi:hypothetical protein
MRADLSESEVVSDAGRTPQAQAKGILRAGFWGALRGAIAGALARDLRSYLRLKGLSSKGSSASRLVC